MTLIDNLLRPLRKLVSRAGSAKAGGNKPATVPGQQELSELGNLFAQARYAELETFARAITERNPELGYGWKALGVALLCQGRTADAVAPMQNAIASGVYDADTRRNLGIALQQQQRYAEAEDCYRQALAIAPAIGELHCNLADVLKLRGRLDEAEASCRTSLELQPESSAAHLVLGTILQEQRRFADAEASYRSAIALDFRVAAAHNFLAIALREQGRLTEAETSCRVALELKPKFAGAHNILGATLMDQGRLAEAEPSLKRALELEPDYLAARINLSDALRQQGKVAEALACYEQLLRLDPGNGVARHWHAALSGSDTESAPPQYVSAVFDNFAKTFDSHLIDGLRYRAPEQIVALIVNAQPSSGAQAGTRLDVLDLGCGTGLAGAAIAPRARNLVGVDLSTNMLEKARARNVYTRLEHADLLTMMQREPAASYDAITATDVFIYVGRFDDVVAEAKRLLRSGGQFGFSIESLDALQRASADVAAISDVRLLPTARFAHSSAYLQRLAAQHGFEVLHFEPTTIRLEANSPIEGWLVVWRA
jgi:predicted TPR repeat methyltransferase